MSSIKQVHSTARPLRVAYFVDLEDCPSELLDAVFAECYSRWGGRRTLIVPVTSDKGVHEDYTEWLKLHDPDIIYSYSNLEKPIIQHIHEIYCPLYLRKHDRRGEPDGTSRDYIPDLPLTSLSCLSTLPIILDRKGFNDFSGSRVFDCDYGIEPPRFLTDNFGTFRTSYSNSIAATGNPDLYGAYTLISEDHHNDPRRTKDKSREYETNYDEYLKKLYTRGGKILTLSMLSEFFGWYLDFYSHEKDQTFNLVIGSTPLDRVLFWNFRQNYSHINTTEIPDMVVSQDDINDDVLRCHILEIIKYRQGRSHGGYPITLRSFSVSENKLKKIAEKLKEECPHARVNVQKLETHSNYIPNTIRNRDPVRYRAGMNWNEPKSKSKSNYTGSQFEVVETLPIHIREVVVPANLRAGVWMLDLCVERQNKQSRISNIEHLWALPRRLRVDRQFKRLDEAPQQDYNYRTTRINRDSLISIPVKYGVDNPSFLIPSDEEAIIGAILNEYEWDDFLKHSNSFVGRDKYYTYETSDKGRYFRGVMQHFGSIFEAEQIILNKFWYQIFSDLGATKKNIKDTSVEAITNKIDKLQKDKRPSEFLRSEKQKRAFASTCLSVSLKVAREKQFVTWKEIREFWKEHYLSFIEQNQSLADRADEIKEKDIESIEQSTQFLCRKKIIFQGQRWTCPSCLHKNWESIESLSALLSCEICGTEQAAPISNDWHFKLNDFILEAMKEHGTTALIWCLIQLHNRARSSFYYIPSTKFFDRDEEGNLVNPKETDLIAVLDGDLYVCEVKSSSGLGETEIKSFADIVNRIRPNVALLAVMDTVKQDMAGRLRNRISKYVDDGIKVEIMILEEGHFDTNSSLPSGNSVVWQVF